MKRRQNPSDEGPAAQTTEPELLPPSGFIYYILLHHREKMVLKKRQRRKDMCISFSKLSSCCLPSFPLATLLWSHFLLVASEQVLLTHSASSHMHLQEVCM